MKLIKTFLLVQLVVIFSGNLQARTCEEVQISDYNLVLRDNGEYQYIDFFELYDIKFIYRKGKILSVSSIGFLCNIKEPEHIRTFNKWWKEF